MDMETEKIKSKSIYFIALFIMCFVLVFLTYVCFLRTIKIDVMKDIKLTYSGENGMASVSAVNGANDINQRTQDFLDSVTYTISPDSNLSNGDTIHVSASYDESIASEYHFKAINTEADITVEGLNNRYEKYEDIDREYLNTIDEKAKKYAQDRADSIYEQEYFESGRFRECNLIYKAFLKSNTKKASDRIIEVFQMVYEGEEGDTYIYYTVSTPNINDGNKVVNSDLFGEKAYLSEQELKKLDIDSYIERLYGSQYKITKIELEDEESPD